MITVADSARGSTSALRSHTFLFSAQRAIVDLLTRLMDLIVPSGRFFGPGGLSHSIRATDQSGTYESLDTAAGLCCWAMTHERRPEASRAPAQRARQQGLQRIARVVLPGGANVIVGRQVWARTEERRGCRRKAEPRS